MVLGDHPVVAGQAPWVSRQKQEDLIGTSLRASARSRGFSTRTASACRPFRYATSPSSISDAIGKMSSRTLLNRVRVGGLEIQRLDGEWVAMPPLPDTLVVNVGDLLDRWSNRRYHSTVHRVINRSGRERLSLVLAYDPDFETPVDPGAFCTGDETPRDGPILCGDYLLWRFEKAFAYRR